MVDSGIPTKLQLKALKLNGITSAVDLIAGDREIERNLMSELDLNYLNIPLDWHNPRSSDFEQYIAAINKFSKAEANVLTYRKLNWPGAVFTYLYCVT